MDLYSAKIYSFFIFKNTIHTKMRPHFWVILAVIFLLCVVCLSTISSRPGTTLATVKYVRTYYRKKPYTSKQVWGAALQQLGIRHTSIPNTGDMFIPNNFTHLQDALYSIPHHASHFAIHGITEANQLAAKNSLWARMEQYWGRKKTRQYLPETYILNCPVDIHVLKTQLEHHVQAQHTPFILKKNIQKKKGLLLVRGLQNVLAHQQSQYVVAQRFLTNIYSIQERKLNLRLYILISSQNGHQEWFLSKLGKCLYTNKKCTDATSLEDLEAHLTSLNLDTRVYDTLPLTLQDLQNHMGHSKYDALFESILDLMKHCKVAMKNHICLSSPLDKHLQFQLFGIDVIFTADQHRPYLLEFNKGPQMNYMNQREHQYKCQIIMDMFYCLGLAPSASHSFIKL